MNRDIKIAALAKLFNNFKDKFFDEIKKIEEAISDTSLDELDLSNLPDEYYVDVFYPETTPIPESDETGTEEKFGGQKPFFIAGESWPIGKYDNQPMQFIGQVIDPRDDSKELLRIFIPQDDDLNLALVMKIILDETNLSQQQIILPPCDDITYEGFKVTEWIKDRELKSYNYIKDNLNITLDFYQLYDKNESSPSFETKIGGTHQFTQLSDYGDEDYANFFILQITTCSFVKYRYGDSGIIHILNDGEIIGDCC